MQFHSLYELDICFDRRALNYPDGRRKAQLFGALIPPNCHSVLDVGGGTGWTTITMRDKYWITTLDLSLPSLIKGYGDRVRANAVNLPFPDRSFDVLLCSQLLEHIPKEALLRVKQEICRIATKALIISVPYRENLKIGMVRCKYCNKVFHTSYHVRSFSEQDLATFFTGWTLAEWHVFGALSSTVGLASIRNPAGILRKAKLPFADQYTICPYCNRQGESHDRNQGNVNQSGIHSFIEVFISPARKMLKLVKKAAYKSKRFIPQEKIPYWIAAIYLPFGHDTAVDSVIETKIAKDRS